MKKKKLFENQRRYNENLKQNPDYNSEASSKMKVILVICVVCSAILIFQLYNIQIINNHYYQLKLDDYSQKSYLGKAPRGEIYDRNGKLLVGNETVMNMAYSRPKGITPEEEQAMARVIADNFEIDTKMVKDRDLKDYWIKNHKDEAKALITEKEWADFKEGLITDNDIYKLQLSRITDEMIKDYKGKEAEVIATEILMSVSSSDPQKIIKENISEKEASILAENSSTLKGFNVQFDWSRKLKEGDAFKSILGRVTTSKQGIPEAGQDEYLALGYNNNDRIGISGLEKQYEDVLKGEPPRYEVSYDENGVLQFQEVKPGKKGSDLELSLDVELQKYVDKKMIEIMKNNRATKDGKELDNMYFVAMKPKTGEVLTMSGWGFDKDGNLYENALGTITDSVVPGSVVKGATVWTGMNQKVITADTHFDDKVWYIKGTPPKKSYKVMGDINEVDALSLSSNVYMFNIAVLLAKTHYAPHQALILNNKEVFELFRKSFSKFGLGIKTGIDLPNEGTGYKGESKQAGHLLDFSIGQYDTYTPIQLAQYVATIANGGKRMEPHVLRDVANVSTTGTNVLYTQEPVVLDDLSDEYYSDKAFERIQLGFHTGVLEGISRRGLQGKPYDAAGKTGTAQTFKDTNHNGVIESSDMAVLNSNFIAFAPFDDPEVSVACMAPYAQIKNSANICQDLSAAFFNKYFKVD